MKKYLYYIGAMGAALAAPITTRAQQNTLAAQPVLAQATVQPERIILNLTADPAHEMAITWRSAPGQAGHVQYAQATNGPDFVNHATTIAAITDDATIAVRENPAFRASYHSQLLRGLKPGTVYAYRVGNDGNWSEWLQFRTAEEGGKPFRFIYMGDMQNAVLSEASRTLRMAFRHGGDAAFVIHAGDLINRHDSDIEWGEWFAAGGFLYAQTPQMPTPGNHEFSRETSLTPQWRRQFTLPENGPNGAEQLKETSWSVDYQGMRLISIDATQLERVGASRTAIISWLEPLLAKNPNRWTVMFLHFPLFSSEPGRDNPHVRAALKPLIDKYKVDMVLQGHDHGYARGAVGLDGPVKNGGGATYAVSVAGPKMYDVGKLPWAQKSAARTQTYQIIDVSHDTLVYRAYTAAGNLLDEVSLRK